MRFCLCILYLLCASHALCFAQRSLETYLSMPLGMKQADVEPFLVRGWQIADTYDLGPYCTYFIGAAKHQYPVPGSFRLLFYFLNDRVVDKELRIATTEGGMSSLLDSVTQRLIQAFGKPAKDSLVPVKGLKKLLPCHKWIFPKAAYTELYEIDLQPHKFDRPDYTIVLLAYSRQYMQAVKNRDKK